MNFAEVMNFNDLMIYLWEYLSFPNVERCKKCRRMGCTSSS